MEPTEDATGSLKSIASTGGEEAYYVAPDGARIRYAGWRAAGPANGTVVHFSGRTEFIEKTLETVETLLGRGFDVFTLDWRGQGLSERLLEDRYKGHIEDFNYYLEDVAGWLAEVVRPRARGPLFLLGHSMGGHIGLLYLHRQPELFAGAVFSAPMVDIHVGGWAKAALAELMGVAGQWSALSRRYLPGTGPYDADDRVFEGNPLTSDRRRFMVAHHYIDADPRLALGGPTIGWFDAARRSSARLRAPDYAGAISTPVLMISCAEDRVVDNEAQMALAGGVMPRCALHRIEGARHEVLMERDELRAQFWDQFDRFLGGGASSARRR